MYRWMLARRKLTMLSSIALLPPTTQSVPQFSFHKNKGEMVESFATRDKVRICLCVGG